MPRSYCFEAATVLFVKQELHEVEYLQCLLAHFRGVRHQEDKAPYPKYPELNVNYPQDHTYRFTAQSISEAALKAGYEPLSFKATRVVANMFQACSRGDIEKLQKEYDKYNESNNNDESTPPFIQPLAVFAAENAQAECLKFCLNHGATFEDSLVNEALGFWVDIPYCQTTEMLDLVYAQNWRDMRTSQSVLNGFAERGVTHASSHPDPGAMLRWYIDHGVEFSSEAITDAVFRGVNAETMARFIEVDSAAATAHGALATAVQRADIRVVEMLLDAGASPNGMGGGLFDVREPGLGSPLVEAIDGRLGNSGAQIKARLAIARVLLQRGADPHEKSRYGESAVERAKRKGGPAWIKLLSEFTEIHSSDASRPTKRPRMTRELRSLYD